MKTVQIPRIIITAMWIAIIRSIITTVQRDVRRAVTIITGSIIQKNIIMERNRKEDGKKRKGSNVAS
ncbi:MAG: hypothetical protein ACLTPC_13770 [Lacrimispora saccharolytica]